MDDEWAACDDATLQRDLEEVDREQELLWSLVALVERCEGCPPRRRLDAVLAGHTVGCRPLPAQRRPR